VNRHTADGQRVESDEKNAIAFEERRGSKAAKIDGGDKMFRALELRDGRDNRRINFVSEALERNRPGGRSQEWSGAAGNCDWAERNNRSANKAL
jgi:hypothetical protein